MDTRVTVPALGAMKRDGRKIVGVVVWDYQMARIVDRVGVDIVSVGDSVGVNLWGQANPLSVTMDQMILVCQAVRRGVSRALLSADFPFGPLQQGPDSAVCAAVRLVKESGVDMVKLDGASDFPGAVSAVDRAGIPVFAQFGITPQTALRHGIGHPGQPASHPPVPDRVAEQAAEHAAEQVTDQMTLELVADARRLEAAGAALLNLTNAGPVAGAEVARAVSIPVVGGLGGGPWLDGRMRMAHAAIGYRAAALDDPAEGGYANVARISFEAITGYAQDVRAGRQIRGGSAGPPPN